MSDRIKKVYERTGSVLIASKEYRVTAQIVIDLAGIQIYVEQGSICIRNPEQKKIRLNDRMIASHEYRGYLADGDVLLAENYRIELLKDRIEVECEKEDLLYSLLPEKNPEEGRFMGFPYYKRSPRIIYRTEEKKIEIRKPPEKKVMGKDTMIQTVLPTLCTVGFTVLMGVVLKRGALTYMSAGMSLITLLFSVKKYREQSKENKQYNQLRREKYLDYLMETQKEIGMERRKEAEAAAYRAPDMKSISAMIDTYSSRLYERSPYDADFLEVCLGKGRSFSQIRVLCNADEMDMSRDELVSLAQKTAGRYQDPCFFPMLINLKKGHLGVVGKRQYTQEMVCTLIHQLAFFHSYHDLQIIMLYEQEDQEKYDHMRWYPHMRIQALNLASMVCNEQMVDQVMGSIQQILKERATRLEEEKKDTLFLPHLLFVIDSPRLIVNHAVMEYLQKEGDGIGFSIIYTADKQENLPENIKTICRLDNSQDAVLLLNEGERINKHFVYEQNTKETLTHDARKLGAIIHEQGISSKIPDVVSFFELYGVRRPEELQAMIRWKKNQSHKSLSVPLGLRAKDDVVSLNLHEKSHGPHGLVAGTTGSGKSEIVQSYILSLAVNFHPNEVGFLLIDYKGGGMANLFADLPHLLGTITNLDKSESMRALISIKSELARRQRIFGENGVNHINGYNLLFREGKVKEPIPHLFIISDEFAELKKEQPEFMSELVSAARIGRSLGVHLILATQKPSGVVDDQIWTNSRFKLCLKVQNAADSNEMLHTPDAANIVNPGRAYLQVGNNEIYELFQSAWSGEIYSAAMENEETEDDRVYRINRLGQGELLNQDLSGERSKLTSKATQLDVTVEYLKNVYQEEWEKSSGVPVKKPWLPPLKNQICNPHMAVKMQSQTDLSMGIGVIDMPQDQKQEEYRPDLMRDGNVLYIASSGYGKSVFLTNVMLGLAVKNTVDNLNFYILDFGNNALMPLAGIPHCASHIMLDEKEKFQKFGSLMEEEIRYRKKKFAAMLVQNYEMYLALDEAPMRAIVILIDNYDAIREMGFEMEDFFTRLTRDGVSLGIYTISTANRLNAVRAAALNNYKNKIAGVNFDENEVRMTVGRTQYALPDIKGRAMVKIGETANVMQLYLPVENGNGLVYINHVKEKVEEIKTACKGREAKHIPILPEELAISAMEKFEKAVLADFYIGLEAERVEQIGFSCQDSPFLIMGDSASGKTNVLKGILSQIQHSDVTVIDSRSRGLEGFRNRVRYVCSQEELENFANDLLAENKAREKSLHDHMEAGLSYTEALDQLEQKIVIIDDITGMASTAGSGMEIIAGRIKKAIQTKTMVIATENPSNFKGQDDLTRELKMTKNGLLLSDQGYLSIFPIKASEAPKKPDAVLMINGTVMRVRLPLAEDDHGIRS